jgi:hypothetical protein
VSQHLTLTSSEIESRSRKSIDMRCAVLALTLFLACSGALVLACSGALAADSSVPQAAGSVLPADNAANDTTLDLKKPDEETPPAAESWWQKVLRGAPNCKSFTDGCRTCSHTVCSNIGIACQPKDWSCNDENLNATPEAAADDKPVSKP